MIPSAMIKPKMLSILYPLVIFIGIILNPLIANVRIRLLIANSERYAYE